MFGFPWFAFGDWLLDGPLVTWIGISGAHATGVIPLTLAGAGAYIYLEGATAWRRPALWLALNCAFFYGIAILAKQTPDAPARVFSARVIALNGSRHEGRQDGATERLARYARLSAGGGAELVFWPESAGDEHIATFAPVLRDRLSRIGAAPRVLMGARETAAAGKYNIIFDLEGSRTLYRKRRLVPFTEYIPGSIFRELFAFFDLTIKNNDLLAAAEKEAPSLADGVAVYPLLCYEIAYPELMGNARARGFILNAGNETWFATGAVRRGTLRQSRARAIESGLAVIRSVSAGYSGLIDADGTAHVALDLPQTRLDVNLPVFIPGETLYRRLGTIAMLIPSIIILIAAAVTELSITWRKSR